MYTAAALCKVERKEDFKKEREEKAPDNPCAEYSSTPSPERKVGREKRN